MNSYPTVPTEPWRACRASFEAVANGQGLGHVLDTTFKPDATNPQAVKCYESECTFMLSVLQKVTAKGHAFRFVNDAEEGELPCHMWEKIVAWKEKGGRAKDTLL